MTATVSAHVDKGSGRAPLSQLMSMALVKFGDNNYDLADGHLVHLLLLLANEIVTEINMHPYRQTIGQIEYYTTPEDVRDVNDLIMINGIAAHYAAQQTSQKAGTLMAMYYQLMNRIFWQDLNGNTAIQVRPRDAGLYSAVNGQAIEDE